MLTYLQMVIVIGSLATTMWGILKFMLRDIHKDLNQIKSDMQRMDSDIKKMDEKHSRAETRIDHLYEVCVEILKTRK